MAKKRGNQAKRRKLSTPLMVAGIISGIFAVLSMMCIPCIMAAYPSIGIFFAFLGALFILLSKYSWFFLLLGIPMLAIGLLLRFSRNNKCE